MGLNQKQREAVEYLDGPLLVLAGPGTGKTQLLSEKVAYILRNTDTNPENILCLTFTESGVTNMKERLKTIAGNDGLKIKVGTYHAFGSEILAQYRNYSEKYDRKLDAAIDEVAQYKIIKNIQEHLPGTDILHGDNIRDIINVISSAKSASLKPSDLKSIAEQNMSDSQVLSETISPLLKNIVPRAYKESYEKAYLPIYEILKDYTNTGVITKNIERIIGGLARDLKNAIIEAESSQKITPLTNWKERYFEKDGKDNYRLKDRVANKKLLSLANVMEQYDKYLRDNGLYDFDDMIEEAAQVLRNDRGFKATLTELYQFIMLDEFQDTNPSQFAIIKELTDYEKPLIMAVGDDDQAIYEFQGALSTNLVDFQKHYNANVIPLTENYRSTQEILDFSRKIINQADDRFADKELVAHKKSPEATQIYRHEFLSSEMEYDFVANKIAELIRSGVAQSEIAVISYKTKYFLPLLTFLNAHSEIKISYEKKDNLLDDKRIHELLTIARFIYEQANNKKPSVTMLEILSYRFFELPLLEVVKIIAQAKANRKAVFDAMLESDNPQLMSVMKFLVDLIAVSFNEPLESFFDYLLGTAELNGFRSSFLEYYTKNTDYDMFSLYEALASLRGKLNKHFGDKKLRLQDLIEMINDYEEASVPLNMTSPYKEASDSVKILSAHKAKGLEFQYVFIISADHLAWGKGKGNNNMLVLPKNLVQIRHTGTTDGEKIRILYVALTRAKQALFITNSLHDFNEKSPTRLEYLKEYQDGKQIISPLIPAGKVETHYDGSAQDHSEKNLQNWLTPYVDSSPDLREIYRERAMKWRISASSLTSFIDIVYAGPKEFFKNYILSAPMESETEAMVYGNLVHKVFENVTKNKLSNEQALQYFVDELEKADLTTEVLQKMREKGVSDISIVLNTFGNILRNGKAEINFAPEKLSIKGVPVTGKIDHLTIDDEEKTIEIYDFKTSGYHKEKWQSHTTLYKYMLQLMFYKLLLNNSSLYKNYKVKRAHILFVTPDKDGEVYDKVYEFSEDDEKKLIKLMQSIYQSVTTLSFIDDNQIFISADKTKNIKDIKRFVDLLLEKYENFSIM